jgi:O-antigen/teichoic acid export membrane protein
MISLKRNVIANYIGRSWSALLGIILIPIYIKFVGIEAYGLVGFFATLTSVIGILNLGFGSTINRELASRSVDKDRAQSQRDLVRTLEVIYWGVSIFAGVIIIIGTPFITNSWINIEKLDVKTVFVSVQLMAISVAMRFPMILYQGGLMGLQRQVLVNAILILNGTLRGIGAILILWLVSPSIQYFFAWQAFTSLTGSLAFFIAIWRSLPKAKFKPKFRLNILKEIWRYAAAISVNAIIGVILTQLDKIILLKMLSLKMFGYYSVATTAASLIWMMIIPFNSALFPKLVQLYKKNKMKEFKKLFHLSSQILSLILLPISAVLIFFSKEILIIWTQDSLVVENAYLIMSFLVFGTMLNGIVSMPVNSANAFGWPMLITYTNAIQAIIIIPLTIGLVYWFNAKGAAIAWIVLNSTYVVFMVPFFFRRYLCKEKSKWFINDTLLPLSSAFIICIISKLIAPSLNTALLIFIWLFSTGIISIIITGLTLSHIRVMLNTLIKTRIKKNQSV